MRRLGLLLVFFSCFGLSACERLRYVLGTGPSLAERAAKLPDFGTLPSFTLTAQNGQSAGNADWAGKVWIANFIFTRCMGPCPLLSGHMKGLQTRFAAEPRLHFISITSDPAYDTPAVLSEYAARFHADPERWQFLTGDLAQIRSLAINAFKVGAGETPDLHSTRFVLVDGQNKVRGFYDSLAPDFQETLAKDAEALAAGLPKPRQDLGH